MKTLINIKAHTYSGDRIATPERLYSYIRPRSYGHPTFRGAARMVANQLGCRPSEVSVTRVESMAYDVK